MRPSTLAFVALLSASACTAGSGNPGQETRQVSGFDAIDVSGPFRVSVQVGPAATLELRGDDNVVPKIEAEVGDSTLHLAVPGRIVTKLPLEATITLPSLVQLDASGAATVTADGLSGEHVEVGAAGATRITLTGHVDAIDIGAAGASTVEAGALTAVRARVDASGASTVEVAARESLHADASGASTVRYHGSPADLRRDVSGASTIEPAR